LKPGGTFLWEANFLAPGVGAWTGEVAYWDDGSEGSSHDATRFTLCC
jgi:hypothetical protein